jgi:hypothetical protein
VIALATSEGIATVAIDETVGRRVGRVGHDSIIRLSSSVVPARLYLLYQGAFVRCSTCLTKAVDLAVIAHGDTVLMNVILMLDRRSCAR